MDLRTAQEYAKEGKWEKIDENIQEIQENIEIVRWAYRNGIYKEDGDYRDLALTATEKTLIFPRDCDKFKERLYGIMKEDRVDYIRCRAAFNAVSHRLVESKEEYNTCFSVLTNFKNDQELGRKSSNYLRQLEELF